MSSRKVLRVQLIINQGILFTTKFSELKHWKSLLQISNWPDHLSLELKEWLVEQFLQE